MGLLSDVASLIAPNAGGWVILFAIGREKGCACASVRETENETACLGLPRKYSRSDGLLYAARYALGSWIWCWSVNDAERDVTLGC